MSYVTMLLLLLTMMMTANNIQSLLERVYGCLNVFPYYTDLAA
jgi:hypothetical protein